MLLLYIVFSPIDLPKELLHVFKLQMSVYIENLRKKIGAASATQGVNASTYM